MRLRDVQREQTDYFAYYRMGRASSWSRNKRRDAIHNLEFPRRRPTHWPGFGPPPPRPGRNTFREPEPYSKSQEDAKKEGPSPGVQRRARRLERLLAQEDMRFEKVLGWGGFGMACLFTMPGGGGQGGGEKVVVKIELEGRDTVEKERRNYELMRDAHHVLHMYNLAAEEAIEQGDLAAGGLFLEFMERGTLEKWIVKMAKERKTFSDRALWTIFDCLARGLVALAYPGKEWRVEESAMDCNEAPRDTLVHFDIDPTNILVGGFGTFGQRNHSIAPIHKIGDLGLGEIFNSRGRRDPERVWYARQSGKVYLYTPEQFTEEWDWHAGAPAADGAPTAGNYRESMNIWQMAWTMYALITLCWPNEKKEPLVYSSKVFDRTVKDATYGGDLMYSGRYDDTDRDLRRLVAQCLYHSPLSRPTLQELEVVIKDKLRSRLDKSEEESRAWAKRFYGEPERRRPAPAPAPARERWNMGAHPPNRFGGAARARFGKVFSNESVLDLERIRKRRADEDHRPVIRRQPQPRRFWRD
ncbi:kinase-like domain-containing protein [Neurospora tetraspora]|uniref:Kinase-like domain-containing protein n=1 Tax=Neurospora tetraspora TaxID=94610 RepID=A0AAE0IZQ8_9PEZI|nr:kinase-like domain-containing protein [Neurospora tetraspora]